MREPSDHDMSNGAVPPPPLPHQLSNGNLPPTTPPHLDNNHNDLKPISKYRKGLPQFLATSAMYLNLFDMGMALGFPTIMLPAVRSGRESVFFNESQASWFASLMFIFQPLGSLISGLILTYLGRKLSLILINIPFFIIWVLIHTSESIPVLMVSSIVLALNIGFLEPPAINYVGEISTPKLRGILTSYSAPIIYLGLIFEFTLGKLYHWRTVALINSTIPVITIAAMIQIPESPMWLLSKGRNQKAKNALCWLRGWVKPELVMAEFKYLLNYKEESSFKAKNNNVDKVYTVETGGALKHSTSFSEGKTKFKQEFIDTTQDGGVKNVRFYDVNSTELKQFNTDVVKQRSPASWKLAFRPEYYKPFFLVSMYFMFYYMSGIPSTRPYFVLIIEEMKIPVDPKIGTIFVAITGFTGSIVSMCVIKRLGKRPLSLISIGGTAFGALACGVLTYRNSGTGGSNILAFVMFLVLAFFTSVGIAAVPWMLLGEVFPLKGRGIASGLLACVAYTLAFGVTKTFPDFHKWFGLYGVFFLYGGSSLVGLIYFYLCLPETEGKTLLEIELHFKQSKKEKQIKEQVLA
uniref:Facilitated trehalose transporter Tret1 n=2 Tax=Cacopsylla melanoneura TaxID=428564 RepID=A0A8D9AET9_9HEMI